MDMDSTKTKTKNMENISNDVMASVDIDMKVTSKMPMGANPKTTQNDIYKSDELNKSKAVGRALIKEAQINMDMVYDTQSHIVSESKDSLEFSQSLLSTQNGPANPTETVKVTDLVTCVTDRIEDHTKEVTDLADTQTHSSKKDTMETKPMSITTTITVDSGGGGDRNRLLMGTGLHPSNSVRVQRMVMEVVEELRMRRAMDKENEDRIRQLMSEKHDIETKCHDSVSKITKLEKFTTEKVSQARRENKSAIQDLSDAKAKLMSTFELSEKEIKSLKDEIRSLQLQNYTLEKKVREQERKSELTTSSHDNHLMQIPGMEVKCATVVKKTEELTTAYDRLDKNVKEACRINFKLAYQNEHSQCEIRKYRTVISQLRSQLMEARTESAFEPEKLKHKITLLETEVAALKKQIDMEKCVSTSLRKQRVHNQSDQKALSNRLSEAHALIAHHTEQSKQGADEIEKVKQNLGNLEGSHIKLSEQYILLQTSGKEERQNHSKEYEEVKQKAEHREQELESLLGAHKELLKNHEELQQLHSTWAKNNVELSKQVAELKAELEKPKTETGVQVEPETLEAENQTEPDVSSTGVQTISSCMITVDGEAQTLYMATVCTASQTTSMPTKCIEVQTESPEREEKLTQTDRPPIDPISQDRQLCDTVRDKPGFKSPKECLESFQVTEPNRTPGFSPIAENSPLKLSKPKKEEQTSPYTRLSASLRCLKSKVDQPATTTHSPKVAETSALTDKRPNEKPSRLRLRTFEPKAAAQQQDPGTEAHKTTPTGRVSFQFLHIPELEKAPGSPADVDTVHATHVIAQGISSGTEPSVTTEQPSQAAKGYNTSTEKPDEQSPEIGVKSNTKRPAQPAGILAGLKVSKAKRSKKVHFANPHEDKVQLIESGNSDSDALFSEDENEDNMGLRYSQASRIDNVLSDDTITSK